MKLSEILKICSENETADFRYSVVCGSTESQVTGITSDSRKMQDGYAFVCIKASVHLVIMPCRKKVFRL